MGLRAAHSTGSGLTVVSVQFQVDGKNVTNAIYGPPFSATFNSTVLPDGQHSLTATATDSGGATVSSAAITITVNNSGGTGGGGGGAGTPLLSGFNPGTTRNNFDGFVGMQFTIGQTPITVKSLGRIYLGGTNAGSSHIVKLVKTDGSDVSGGSVTVIPAGTIGQFTYVALPSPVTLTANTAYYLVSKESPGGETWYDYTPVTVGGGVATVQGAAYTQPSGQYYVTPGLSGTSYVPVNLLYTQAGAPTVVITSPTGGTVSGTAVSLVASATAGSGLSIASVQFQVDGANVGSVLTASPYSTTLNTTTLANGAHNLTAIATDSANVSSTSSTVVITVNNTTAGTMALITGQSPGSLRRDYTGSVGMAFTVGSSPITVTHLGRIYVNGNSAMHTLSLIGGNGIPLPGGSVSLTPTGTADQFSYGALSAPLTLAANATYYLLSTETNGVDQWYNIGPVSPTAAASIVGPVYTDAQGNDILVGGLPGNSYVPVNLLYRLANAPTPPTVTITSPSGGNTNGSINVMGAVALTATASANGGFTITGVQFKIDNIAFGGSLTASPYTTNLDTTIYQNGTTHSLTAVATDSAGNSTVSAVVMFTVNNSATSGNPLVTSFTGTTLRNNFLGFVGLQFKVGSLPITVYSLGRVFVTGNTATHQVKLVNRQTGADVVGGSAQVSFPSGATNGGFTYASLTTPVTLSANTSYCLISNESTDQWWDVSNINVSGGSVLIEGPVYNTTSGYVLVGNLASQVASFVPVSMTYSTNQ